MTRRDPRHTVWLEKVWHELGSRRVEERWITDKDGWFGFQEGSKIVISPLNLVETIIHEALHAAYPQWSERWVKHAARVLFEQMSDDEAYRLYDAYARKVVRIARPVSSED